jgi:hypothetical protein
LPPLHQALNMRSSPWWPGGASGPPGLGPDAPAAASSRLPGLNPLSLPPLASIGRRRSSGEEDLAQRDGPAHPVPRRRPSPPDRPWRPSE